MELKIIVFFQFQHSFALIHTAPQPPLPHPHQKKTKTFMFCGLWCANFTSLYSVYFEGLWNFCFSLLYYLEIFALECVFDNIILMVNWLRIILILLPRNCIFNYIRDQQCFVIFFKTVPFSIADSWFHGGRNVFRHDATDVSMGVWFFCAIHFVSHRV